jgi:hypothetical protein
VVGAFHVVRTTPTVLRLRHLRDNFLPDSKESSYALLCQHALAGLQYHGLKDEHHQDEQKRACFEYCTFVSERDKKWAINT